MWDGREAVASYYDLAPHHPSDIPWSELVVEFAGGA